MMQKVNFTVGGLEEGGEFNLSLKPGCVNFIIILISTQKKRHTCSNVCFFPLRNILFWKKKTQMDNPEQAIKSGWDWV